MANRGSDRADGRDIGTRRGQGEKPTDVGRTMGGGSLGHAPADDVVAEAPLRNSTPDASPDAATRRQDHGASDRGRGPGDAAGASDDPVMPDDDATLRTKI